MRKFICLLIAVMLCASVALPAFAAEGEFVPSITYKDGPTVKSATMNGEDVGDCVVVTSINEAKDKSTDITQEERDLLLELYEKLSDGSMVLPLSDDYVIRELVDVSFKYEDCRSEDDHGQKDEERKKDGVTLTVDFYLGVGKYTDVIVMVYIDGQWKAIESVENKGNGIITCVFEDVCPVAFVVKSSDYETTPKTGDEFGRTVGVWIGVLCVSAAALVAVVVISRKKKK